MLARRHALAVLAGTVVALLTACSSTPSPGSVELAITADKDINPDPAGRPSPVVLRIYQLAAAPSFQAADYFQLFEKEQPTLGPDLVAREEVTVAPGATRNLTVALKPNAQLIGIAASFRDIDHATWRALIEVPPNKTTKAKAMVGKLQVSLAKS